MRWAPRRWGCCWDGCAPATPPPPRSNWSWRPAWWSVARPLRLADLSPTRAPGDQHAALLRPARRSPAGSVWLQAADRPPDRPGVIPTQHRAKERRQDPQERAVGVDSPLKAHAGPGRDRCERPDAAAAQVAVDLGLDPRRRRQGDDDRTRPQVVGQAPLEVLAGDGTDRRRPIGGALKVDRPPPVRIGPGIRERGENRLRRDGD